MMKKLLNDDALQLARLNLIKKFEDQFKQLVEQDLIPAESYQTYITRAIRTAKRIATEAQ